MQIAVTRRIHADQVRRLEEHHEVSLWDNDLPPSIHELAQLLKGQDGALTLLTDIIDGTLLDSLPTLKVVSNFAVGFDNIDLEAATERGVAVCTTPDVLTESTAEFAMALIFAVARQLVPASRAARAGDWKTWYPMRFLGLDLSGATLGIVGMGRIGQHLANIASAVGMDIIYADQAARAQGFERVDLDELLQRADIISLHVPLTETTTQMINARAIALMKDEAILINTARGAIVDTPALIAALREGKLFGVGLDVTDPEPLPAEHDLYQFDRVTITPHIASATIATRHKMAQLAVDNLLAVIAGKEPPNCLNPEVLHNER